MPELVGAVMSLSARRAWIEIPSNAPEITVFRVALRKESVDRNCGGRWQKDAYPAVALRKESVDRNRIAAWGAAAQTVALRKESVDRNSGRATAPHILFESLSARRAWIEIRIAAAFEPPALGRSPQGERG